MVQDSHSTPPLRPLQLGQAGLCPGHRRQNIASNISFSEGGRAHARCLITTHYFKNECFLAPDQLLQDAFVLKDIPGIIVHGRFDCVSPLNNAHQLRKAWPTSQLYIVREAGHSATEPAMIDALIRATRDMALRFEADFHV